MERRDGLTAMDTPGSERSGRQDRRRIRACLVPLDGSGFARLALLAADELAARLDADVHLLSAVARVDDVPTRHQQLAALQTADRIRAISVVVDRDPAGVIHETVEHLGGAVACLASHGRQHSLSLRTSVPAGVLSRGRDSIVVAGPEIGRRKGVWWSDAPLSLADFRGGGVVACVDGTATSGRLVDVARQWATELAEPLVVLAVVEPSLPLLADQRDRLFGPQGDPEAYLESLVEPARGLGMEAMAVPVYDPVGPAEGVHSYLEDAPAALVVVGAHHRDRPRGVALSGTPADIIRRSPSPVLVVP